MSLLSSSRYLLVFFLLDFCLKAFPKEQNRSFDAKNFGPDANLSRLFALYGDAKAVKSSRSVRISGSGAFSAGRMICRKPINLVEGYPRKMVSFSVHFEFSMSGVNGDGLAFIMVPVVFPLNIFNGGSMGMLEEKDMKFLAVEFDTFKDEKYGDLNNNHVGVDLGSLVSVKVSNVSSIKLELNSGEKLQSWIDYEANSKVLEVRLGRLGGNKQVDPLLSHHIDLSRMWKNEDVLLGLTSSSGNSSQKCDIYSWNFVSRTMPHWMHSEPMNPETFVDKGGEEIKVHRTRNDCAMKILAALIFGGGCGALGAFVVLFVFAIFGGRRPVTPEDLAVQPEKLEHKTLVSAIDKPIQDGKK
ncbi:L-type lectin-domain containing receptor kinase VIII.2 [Dorcoceras hygrometricum]|uniref:L-type lectin-domain containing receptor kinase VIII.2 n=1 Tax=Dorcoceras hygrometricum TaxID=472368 RepID=A0A2Z7ALD4_9LAMI|nr:L-type lectin-domain containing receptor kinase VIII.2 [Dorcoceras hygrometricum]KZV51740.1 L-type lectin-domain containing receptor kinase VIII.2 [Dorcoceras hygrometricum]